MSRLIDEKHAIFGENGHRGIVGTKTIDELRSQVELEGLET